MKDGDFEFRSASLLGNITTYLWPRWDKECFDHIANDFNDFMPRVLDRVNRKGICVQAGGNAGMYPIALADFFQEVHTFEANRVLLELLVENKERLSADNVYVHKGVLWNRDGAEIALYSDRPQNTGMYLTREPTEIMKSFELDRLTTSTIDSLGLKGCDFIQLDIEGAEYEAMVGAKETVMNYRPVVLLEQSWKIKELEALMDGYGYDQVEGHKADRLYIPR